MFENVDHVQRNRAVSNIENRDNKVEITEEIAKEIETIVSLPSKSIFDRNIRQAWKSSPLIKDKIKVCKTKKEIKEA